MLQKSSELTRKPWFGWPMTWFFFIFGYCTHVGRLCLILETCFSYTSPCRYLSSSFSSSSSLSLRPSFLLLPCSSNLSLSKFSLSTPSLSNLLYLCTYLDSTLSTTFSLSLYQTYPHQTFYHTYLHQTYLSQTFSLSKLPLSNKSLTHLSSKLISIKITFVRFITPIKNKPLPS